MENKKFYYVKEYNDNSISFGMCDSYNGDPGEEFLTKCYSVSRDLHEIKIEQGDDYIIPGEEEEAGYIKLITKEQYDELQRLYEAVDAANDRLQRAIEKLK